MANSNIFCSTPWHELHIYWDGSLGICCQESHKLYSGTEYNIATMSIADWFNSQPVKDLRKRILNHSRISECARCYIEEDAGGHSRRFKSNQKSVIFQQAFDHSFDQSPGRRHFAESGLTITHPVDLHIDLGNFCNLACKMCNAQASSKIAVQEVKWGIESSIPFVGTNWTKNQAVWHSFKQQLLAIPELKNIHLMGGETLLTDRFEDLVDTLIEHGRFEVCFSFVTNGTVFNADLVNKLCKFQRVGIEVSIETLTQHNTYTRQGTDTALVLRNIDRYLEKCNGSSVTVTLRPAVSLLTIGQFGTLLQYALDKKLVVKSLMVDHPEFLSATALPLSVKQQYMAQYHKILSKIGQTSDNLDYNASDPSNYQLIVRQLAQMCLNILSSPTPTDVDKLHAALVQHCGKWDCVYGYDAKSLYPELADIWDQYDY